MSGANFSIIVTYESQYSPKLAYNPVTNQYLIVWTEGRFNDVYGRLVNADGSLSGSEFPISSAANHQVEPEIVYNPSSNQFLVVSYDDRLVELDWDIYGQFVNSDGSLSGANFPISTAMDDQSRPVVAYNSADNQYLVVWQDERNTDTGYDVYARVVNADGTMGGSDFPISTDDAKQLAADIAYAPASNRFLVVWEHGPVIYGRLVNADTTFAGPEFLVAPRKYTRTVIDPAVGYDPCTDPQKLDRSDSSHRICPKGEIQWQSDGNSHRSSRPRWC